MRHRIFGKKLGRNHGQRLALFRSQVRSMFTHGFINTTEAKAKAVIPIIEKLASTAQKADINSKRSLYRYLQDRSWVGRVEDAFQKTFVDQQSNFTKVTRIKHRQGDDAVIVKLSFTKPVDFSPVDVGKKPKAEEKVSKTKKAPATKKDLKTKSKTTVAKKEKNEN